MNMKFFFLSLTVLLTSIHSIASTKAIIGYADCDLRGDTHEVRIESFNFLTNSNDEVAVDIGLFIPSMLAPIEEGNAAIDRGFYKTVSLGKIAGLSARGTQIISTSSGATCAEYKKQFLSSKDWVSNKRKCPISVEIKREHIKDDFNRNLGTSCYLEFSITLP